jgi:hypothetical protein
MNFNEHQNITYYRYGCFLKRALFSGSPPKSTITTPYEARVAVTSEICMAAMYVCIIGDKEL